MLGLVGASSTLSAQHVEKFVVIFFHQQGSGLRVVGVGSDTTRHQAGTFLRVKNYTEQRVRGFEIVFVAAGDSRIQPGTKVEPQIVKRSEYIESAIDPGQTFDLYNVGPRFDEFLPRLKEGGARFGVVRAGISRVVYADGTEQKFDLLTDEQAGRSTAPPDTGGMNPFRKPVSANAVPKMVLARAVESRPACSFRAVAIPAAAGAAYLYSDSESETIPFHSNQACYLRRSRIP